MNQDVLNIIEPTLEGEEGHCYNFINSLCQVAGDQRIVVWGGRSVHITFNGQVTLKRFFVRQIRRLQALWLYRKLLRQPGRMFISTAGRTDLVLLDLASREVIPGSKVFLYMHWLKLSENKYEQMTKLARKQPNLTIITPTQSVCDILHGAGFHNTLQAPYPITPCQDMGKMSQRIEFSTLLFAGSARQDKGFHAVVSFVEYLAENNMDIPVTLQTSTTHYGKVDEATTRDILWLDALHYPFLKRCPETLTDEMYRKLYRGAICLQPYNQNDFADRISGITLDALSSGCPVITVQGTWMARIAARFDAGLAIPETSPGTILKAVNHIRDDYHRYQHNAFRAGQTLQREHSASGLFSILTAGCTQSSKETRQ